MERERGHRSRPMSGVEPFVFQFWYASILSAVVLTTVSQPTLNPFTCLHAAGARPARPRHVVRLLLPNFFPFPISPALSRPSAKPSPSSPATTAHRAPLPAAGSRGSIAAHGSLLRDDNPLALLPSSLTSRSLAAPSCPLRSHALRRHAPTSR
ncbi:hypothetical protein C8F04DRAFT_1318269 [Mycena alexandri]|uniref:Uncharacterized protein n=1 Tax=Mycena alexandri TaxID=1745969 RepID=A0AAD6S3X9_9AGAR|nr:hypothetical protein C8F04DRAFT_1318269 [Mycena alexandri]